MNTLEIIKSLKGKTEFLLKELNYNSIKEAKSYVDGLNGKNNTEKKVLSYLKNEYNKTVNYIKKQERENFIKKYEEIKKQKKQKRLKKQTETQINKLINIDIIDVKSKVKPTFGEFNQFKKYVIEKSIINPDVKQYVGDEGLKLINYTIPLIREQLKTSKGIKLFFNFQLMFKHLFDVVAKEKFIVNYTTKASIINNESEIMDFINNLKGFIQLFIQGYEGYGSDLVFLYIQSFRIHIAKYNPLKIKSYLPLPKEILNKKCCINIKNEDEKCLMYCVLYHIYPNEIKTHPERPENYNKLKNTDIYKKLQTIKYPVALKDIEKIENIIDYGINVYDCEKRVLRITKKQYSNDDKYINLLVIGDHIKNVKVNHYVYIKKLDVFVMNNKVNKDGIHTTNKSFICNRCLHGFSTKERLEKHLSNGCDMFDPIRTKMPNQIKNKKGELVNPIIQFKDNYKKFKAPVAIYADFETFIQKTKNIHNNKESSTTKLADLPPCSYSFNIVSDYPELNFGLTLYRGQEGDDIAEHFLKSLLDYGEKIMEILDTEKPMMITEEQEKEFKNCNICHICEEPIHKVDIKVRDHDHINGLYRGCTHQDCNINLNHKNLRFPSFSII